MKYFNKSVWLLVAALTMPAYAAEAPDLERELAEARRALDEAAGRLAELHTQKYGEHVRSQRAMLGILLGDGPMRGGVEMVGVTPGGGAEQAGLEAGDKIVRISDIELSDVERPMRELSRYMKQVSPGESVAVVYERDGKRIDAVITTQAESKHMLKMVTKNMDSTAFAPLVEFDSVSALAAAGVPVSKHLMHVSGDLAEYFSVEEGVIVIEAPTDSDLQGGDVLLEIDGDAVTSVAQALVSLGEPHTQDVRVKRKGRNRTIQVEAGEFAQVEREEITVVRVKTKSKDGSSSDAKDVHVEIITD